MYANRRLSYRWTRLGGQLVELLFAPTRATDLGGGTPTPESASRVAAGVLNPITGKYWVKTWKADQLFPFAHQSYAELGQLLGTPNGYYHACPIVWRLTSRT